MLSKYRSAPLDTIHEYTYVHQNKTKKHIKHVKFRQKIRAIIFKQIPSKGFTSVPYKSRV